MKRQYTLILLFAVLWFAGCGQKEPPAPPPVDDDPKTFIMYGNINYSYFKQNVESAARAVAAGALIEGQRVIVCSEVLGSQGKIAQNIIFELLRDRTVSKGYRCDTLRVYKGDDVKTTLDPADMKYLLGEMRELAPANHYGLALGAHATGWVPKEITISSSGLRAKTNGFSDLWAPIGENPLTRYIGHTDALYNNVYRIDIADFAASVGSMEWDFVLFDACLMGSVEAVYEMRDLAPYLIVSPAEIMIDGFPYDDVVKVLFNDWTNLKGVCAAYMAHYSNSNATISLVDTSELENLAKTVRNIRIKGYNTVDPTAAVIQYYEGLPNHVFYDLDDYMRHWARDTYYYELFYNQLLKTLPYTDHTPYLYSALGYAGRIRLYCYSGLTAFIPYAGKDDLIPWYHGTSWYKAVYQ